MPDYKNNILDLDRFENGSINDSGAESTYRQNARARSKTIEFAKTSIEITSSDGYSFCCYDYASDTATEATAGHGWITDGSHTIPDGTYYRLLLRDPNNDASTSVNTPAQLLAHFTARTISIGKMVLPDNVTYALKDERLPSVSGDENGSYLRVVNGEWAVSSAGIPSVSQNSSTNVLSIS